ncbi:MAG: hypothetical protein A3G47_00995 [Candidatus Zambryskibacteria bacterium RIFCSPLOWO2_12_FULL_39_45]|uniref:Uncharacterized protein n=2 Tax=Candidatus Zambryskiibacteriota TaxID=1817925 RepID=A0A1G2T8C6_9BACT|nr:MAG: hypothetical protein UT81_C0004G0039 [Parcubacteria group bacterium GW2011_GWA2_40_14]OHA93524.1 MAG: hypothetical protein A2W58_02440 [Candidatus Zambryskibacteria bacterium RIFCSPHIGHO2_02_38_10.5]OHA97106.1 MAG: hypothetical protein A3C63_01485 [Candidatus Zambryskibacteria bacterium RIFCSPHIGHO2_02_FULL_39_82]OHA97683.1 MAG: hypothetical protein A3E32_03100 [Candidatus Zambryskibacteria bacterium RIFCSPHIGHO2_12_FULL_38_37]OHB08574.1 MAG: hypothetical protein A2W64_01200 [Candidatus
MENESYTAVVQKVMDNGKHGPYVVATNEKIGTITFSLEPLVWQEKGRPERGNIVVLSEIRKKRAGWRANSGRFFRPSDEQSETKHSKELK